MLSSTHLTEIGGLPVFWPQVSAVSYLHACQLFADDFYLVVPSFRFELRVKMSGSDRAVDLGVEVRMSLPHVRIVDVFTSLHQVEAFHVDEDETWCSTIEEDTLDTQGSDRTGTRAHATVSITFPTFAIQRGN